MIPAFFNKMQESKMFNILLTAENFHRIINNFNALVSIAQKQLLHFQLISQIKKAN